jgi:VanZ family protein
LIKAAVASWKLDRILLAVYLIAMLALLMSPLSGPKIEMPGFGIDKYLHFALFGGLAVFLRWNLAARRLAALTAVAAAFVVAAATEIAQGLIAYRSAELLDLIAGLFGAVLGAAGANRIMASPAPGQLLGITVTIVGFFLSVLFVLADVVGLGNSHQFGTLQIAGTVLGAVVTAGGIVVYRTGKRVESSS